MIISLPLQSMELKNATQPVLNNVKRRLHLLRDRRPRPIIAFLFFGIEVDARVHGSVLVRAHRVVGYVGRVSAMIGRYARVDGAVVGIPDHVVLRVEVGEGAGACLVERQGGEEGMQGRKPHLVCLKKCLRVEDW